MRHWRRIIAFYLLICFVTTFPSWAAPLPGPAALFPLEIPSEIASVVSSFHGQGAELVILVEDAHANPEAQNNIRAVLEYLAAHEGLSFVGLEGASQPIFPEAYHFLPYPDLNRQAANYLVSKGEFSGAELFALEIHEQLSNAKVRFQGVEDEAMYEEDFRLFQQGLRARNKIAAYFDSVEKNLNASKSSMYHSALKQFDKRVKAYEKGGMKFAAFLTFLERHTAKILHFQLTDPKHQREYPSITRTLRVHNAEAGMDAAKVRRDIEVLTRVIEKHVSDASLRENLIQGLRTLSSRQFFELLYAASLKYQFSLDDYQHLRRFSEQRILQSEIRVASLRHEIQQLVRRLYDALAQTDAERKLLNQDRDNQLMRRLLTLEATNEEWKKIRSSVVSRESSVNSLPTTDDRRLTTVFHFYELAEQRNAALITNTLGAMRKGKHQRAALVAGGFHTEGLAQLLREKNISYVVIAPRIQENFGSQTYRDMMTDSWQTLFDRSHIARRITSVEHRNFLTPAERLRDSQEKLHAVIESGALAEAFRRAKNTNQVIKVLGANSHLQEDFPSPSRQPFRVGVIPAKAGIFPPKADPPLAEK
ncbi:MAG: hypothetical protein HY586_04860, partial [Candidatus Omnitrophica bacterium]|nr:hypothetical protein [Candidatus Omnitrophota bacterium]